MTTERNNQSRAFSLVEVLMAVLILGLGLLGLGAIMPAVVKQQRVGTDQTFGTLAGRSVAALVKGNGLLNLRNATGSTNEPNLMNYSRWEAWARSIASANYTYDIPEDGTWRILDVEAQPSGAGTGAAYIGPYGNNVQNSDLAQINLQDRLFPSTTSFTAGSAIPEPQFIVDLAVRRVTPIDAAQISGGNIVYEVPGNFTVQVAFIVRRIDQRIRTTGNVSLMEALTNTSLATVNRRWPISEDANGNPLGDGSNTNGARYSLPYAVNVAYDPAVPDRLIVESAEDSPLSASPTQRREDLAFRQVAQPGQTIIDNLGNIYTVQGADDRVQGQLAVRISPSVTARVPASTTTDRRRLRQIVVCAQPPAAVNIITVNP